MEEYKYYLAELGKDDKTITQYVQQVEMINTFIHEYQLKHLSEAQPIHVQFIKEHLKDNYNFKPSTINSYLSALRSYFNFLEKSIVIKNLKLIKVAEEDIKQVDKKEVQKLIIYLNRNEKPTTIRDRYIVYLMIFAGLRRSEISNLKVQHIENKVISIVDSKHEKYRTIPMNEELYNLHLKWLEIRNTDSEYLLPSNKGGQLTNRGINHLFERFNEKGYDIKPHDLRHYFANNLIENNEDIDTIANLLGHTNINNTTRYLKRRQGRKEKAISKLKL